jgi:hypothetical protein
MINPPNYAIPNYNCVDACITAINSAGKTVGDCKSEFPLTYYPNTNSTGRKKWIIKLSDPRKLEKAVKDFK